jgi:hypothetical protein
MFLDKFKKNKIQIKTRQETSKQDRVQTHYQAMSGPTLDHGAIRPKT